MPFAASSVGSSTQSRPPTRSRWNRDDPQGGGFVMAPSPRQASAAGVLRAAWRAHGGTSGGPLAPFAVGLTSAAVRRALALPMACATASRWRAAGPTVGARHPRCLRRRRDRDRLGGVRSSPGQYPLTVDSVDSTGQASAQRLVSDGWKLAQVEIKSPGAVVAAVPVPTGAGRPDISARRRRTRCRG